MTKEELKPIDVSKYTVTESGNVIKSEEKETNKEDFFRQNFSEYCRGDTFLSPYWDLFEAGYELKQNILSQHILELQADKGRLIDRVKELEAQNEEMKCCSNCKNEGDYKEPYRYGTGWCNICKRHKVAKGNFDKWEIKEK